MIVSDSFRQDLSLGGGFGLLGFFVARIVSPCHDRLVFDQNVQEEECCISSCQRTGREGRREVLSQIVKLLFVRQLGN